MHVDVTVRGDLPAEAKRRAIRKIGNLDRYVGSRALRAHVILERDRNPRIERPAQASCEIDLHGPIVRGHVHDLDMSKAIDALAEHMERQLRRFVDRRLDEQRVPRQSGSNA
jgi:ribosomal subunit interface protein